MKFLKYIFILIFIAALAFAANYFITSNKKDPIVYDTVNPTYEDIQLKAVATGKVVPEEEVEVKPQVSGIIDKIYVEEGQSVTRGKLMARIKVVPDEQSLNSAKGRIRSAEIALNNAKIEYNRNKPLVDKGVVSAQDFQRLQLDLENAEQNLAQAKSDLQIIKEGSSGGDQAITNIRAQTSGTILEIPIEEGDQVIQSNNFNDGTTVATIADMSKLIFEGQVDEAEVGKLYEGMPLEISLGALQEAKFDAKLRFIAPKGTEEQGAVQFKIEGDLVQNDSFHIRAGYSANASIVLEDKHGVLAIEEALLQFDLETNEPYVEIEVGEQEFEKREVELGISDGINVEILSGLTENDKIKVWNKTYPVKKGEDEEEEGEE